MDRRTFIGTLAGGLVAPPLAAEAQQTGKVYRVGFLWDSPTMFPDALEAFRRRLRDLGYVEGRTIIIEYRWTEGKPERMREHADPIGSGHVPSLAHPGGNITGLSLMMTETNVKGLELFKEVVPALTRVAVVWDPATPSHGPGLKAAEGAGPSLGLNMQSVAVRSATEYDSAFLAMVRERADGVLVLSTPLFIAGAKRLAELALSHKLPSLFGPKHHVEAGGLMSYSPDRADLWRRGAIYVDKILKGAKPGDLPVEQPSKFELVINLKTANVLGLTIPQTILARADEVIR
jgi:putative ABC transport system substrate-binding protein